MNRQRLITIDDISDPTRTLQYVAKMNSGFDSKIWARVYTDPAYGPEYYYSFFRDLAKVAWPILQVCDSSDLKSMSLKQLQKKFFAFTQGPQNVAEYVAGIECFNEINDEETCGADAHAKADWFLKATQALKIRTFGTWLRVPIQDLVNWMSQNPLFPQVAWLSDYQGWQGPLGKDNEPEAWDAYLIEWLKRVPDVQSAGWGEYGTESAKNPDPRSHKPTSSDEEEVTCIMLHEGMKLRHPKWVGWGGYWDFVQRVVRGTIRVETLRGAMK